MKQFWRFKLCLTWTKRMAARLHTAINFHYCYCYFCIIFFVLFNHRTRQKLYTGPPCKNINAIAKFCSISFLCLFQLLLCDFLYLFFSTLYIFASFFQLPYNVFKEEKETHYICSNKFWTSCTYRIWQKRRKVCGTSTPVGQSHSASLKSPYTYHWSISDNADWNDGYQKPCMYQILGNLYYSNIFSFSKLFYNKILNPKPLYCPYFL